MNSQLIKDIILERNSKALFLEDIFNKALMGSAQFCGKNHVAVYDSDKCIKILIKEFKMGELEAFEKFENTIKYSSLPDNKPIFFSDFRKTVEPPEVK